MEMTFKYVAFKDNMNNITKMIAKNFGCEFSQGEKKPPRKGGQPMFWNGSNGNQAGTSHEETSIKKIFQVLYSTTSWFGLLSLLYMEMTFRYVVFKDNLNNITKRIAKNLAASSPQGEKKFLRKGG